MKKMFFTAIVLVAFSGASMAGTIKEDNSKSIFIETNETISGDDCKETAIDLYELIMDWDCGSPGCGGDDIGLLNDLMSLCQL